MRFKLFICLGMCLCLAGCSFIPGLEKENGSQFLQKETPVFEDKDLEQELSGHWYYDNLSDEDRNIYNIMYNGILNWEDDIYLGGVPVDVVKRINSIIMSEHPELFYVGLKYSYTKYKEDEEVITFNPIYCMSEDEYALKLEQVEKVADNLIEEIKSATTSQYEAELLVHDYIVDNTDYFTDNTADTKEQLASFRTIYGTLIEKKANCMGYAATMTYLMNKLGIQCGSMIGNATNSKGNSESHEWNFVNINDEWYYVDVCWDDPNSDIQMNINTGMRHGYFNLTSEEMQKSREFETNSAERGEVPLATSIRDNYYTRNNMQVSSLEEYQSWVNTKFNTMVNEEDYLEVQFVSEDDYNSAYEQMSSIVNKASLSNFMPGEYMYSLIKDDRTLIIVLTVKRAS